MSQQRIFVSIASYRDPELIPTIEDCLAKARFPQRLRFGICWQHGPEEDVPRRWQDDRFRVLDVDWRDSRGACWARAEVMKLWADEEWYLQLDSHHRFAADWDVRLLQQAAGTGSSRPLLTTYAAPFTPGQQAPLCEEPMRMEFDRFTEEGIALFRPGPIPGWQTRSAPLRSRFISAHFLFAPGRFVTDVPYDPHLYFLGEEITLAVRAFTQGYDLFHPSEPIVWHEYTRSYRTKHWDDHQPERGVTTAWYERDVPSRARAGRLLNESCVGPLACGTVRTLADYEAYAGLNFRWRRAQDYTLAHGEPPNPVLDDGWVERSRDRTVRITLDRCRVAGTPLEHAHFWYVGVQGADGRDLCRADADQAEIRRLLGNGTQTMTLVRTFQSTAEPATWTIRGASASGEWGEAIRGQVVSEETACLHPSPLAGIAASAPAPAADACADPACLYPRAAADLTWERRDDAIIVRRTTERDRFHVVNATGALLLDLADGTCSVAGIVDAVRMALDMPDIPAGAIEAFFASAARTGVVAFNTSDERYAHA